MAYAPPPASAQPAPSPAPATASSVPVPQSTGADAFAVAVSITQPDPETRLRSVAVQSVFAALPCALATPTTAAASAPAPLLPPTPAAPRQTSDAHNIATAARARHYPALPPARPYALKIRPCAPPLHYPNRLTAQQPEPLKQPQHPPPHCRLHLDHTCFICPRPASTSPYSRCKNRDNHAKVRNQRRVRCARCMAGEIPGGRTTYSRRREDSQALVVPAAALPSVHHPAASGLLVAAEWQTCR